MDGKTMVDISGLDKAILFDKMFYYGQGDSNYDANDAIQALLIKGLGYIDMFQGVVFKIDFNNTLINTYYYDNCTQGDLCAQEIVNYLRQIDL